MAEYKASKTQLKALDALGIEHSNYISYNTAGELLEAAGWTRDGRGEDLEKKGFDTKRDGYNEF